MDAQRSNRLKGVLRGTAIRVLLRSGGYRIARADVAELFAAAPDHPGTLRATVAAVWVNEAGRQE